MSDAMHSATVSVAAAAPPALPVRPMGTLLLCRSSCAAAALPCFFLFFFLRRACQLQQGATHESGDQAACSRQRLRYTRALTALLSLRGAATGTGGGWLAGPSDGAMSTVVKGTASE